jgi:hypothetical protein
VTRPGSPLLNISKQLPWGPYTVTRAPSERIGAVEAIRTRVISTGLRMVGLDLSERLGLLMKRVPLMGTITPCGERRS